MSARRSASSSSGPVSSSSNGRRQQSESDRETMASLKSFVKEMAKSKGRAVEMRLAVLCGICVGLRVFYSPTMGESEAAKGVIFFILIGILIIILTTWLDYFPSKIESFKLRSAGGQGLPLACLLPSIVCVSLMCSITDTRPDLLETLNVYLVLCCTVSLATMIPTLVYKAPYPNSIVLYNFILMVLIVIINSMLEIPFYPLIIHCIVYSVLAPFLLHNFPQSFTLCEASLISQGLSLLITDTVLQVSNAFDWYDLTSVMKVGRSEGLLFLEIGLTGFVLCCTLFSICLYKIAATDDKFHIHVWSVVFLQLSFLVGLFCVIPCLELLLGKPPIAWLFGFMFADSSRISLVLFWMSAVAVSTVIVLAQSSPSRFLSIFKVDDASSLWMRKWFHLLALVVYISGIIVDPSLLRVSASVVSVLFFVVELIRLFRIWPFGETVHRLLVPFVDSRDEGDLILTHVYLLLGFSLPVWLYPFKNLNTVAKLSMYSGVLSLGVGDSIAAVSGTLIGKIKWPGTRKTVEGTLMSVISQFIVAAAIMFLDQDIPSLSQREWFIMGAAIIGGGAMEAYTHQVDNLVLGIFVFSILIAFL